MKEVRRYSDKVLKTAAARLRHAASYLPPRLSTHDRCFVLARQAQQQGLQPWDFVRDTGRDALVAIALALPIPMLAPVDTETFGQQPPRTLIFDSLDVKTVSPAVFANQPLRVRQRTRKAARTTLSSTWERVLDYTLGISG